MNKIYVVTEKSYHFTFLSKAFYSLDKANEYAELMNKEDEYACYEAEEMEIEDANTG